MSTKEKPMTMTAEATSTARKLIALPGEPLIEPDMSKVIMMRDPKTGRYVEHMVPMGDPDRLEVVYDPSEDIDTDPTNIEREWAEAGRNKQMTWRWLNTNPRYSAYDRSHGYEPVDPKQVRMSRFPVQNLPGVGECYVFGDVYLCEIPTNVAAARLKAQRERFEREEIDRLYSTEDADADFKDRSKGVATMIRHAEGDPLISRSFERSNPVQNEVDSYHNALDRIEANRQRAGARR